MPRRIEPAYDPADAFTFAEGKVTFKLLDYMARLRAMVRKPRSASSIIDDLEASPATIQLTPIPYGDVGRDLLSHITIPKS